MTRVETLREAPEEAGAHEVRTRTRAGTPDAYSLWIVGTDAATLFELHIPERKLGIPIRIPTVVATPACVVMARAKFAHPARGVRTANRGNNGPFAASFRFGNRLPNQRHEAPFYTLKFATKVPNYVDFPR
jgi:hypothetical protein